MVYQWLSGILPFEGTYSELYHKHMAKESLPSLVEIAPDLPKEVEKVVFKALANKPEDRYESIQDFADALEIALQPPVVVPELPPIVIEDEEKAVAQSSGAEAVMLEAQPSTEQIETKADEALLLLSSTPSNTGGGLCLAQSAILIIGLGLIALGVFMCPCASVKGIQDAYAFYSRATKSTQGVVTKVDSQTTCGGGPSFSCSTVCTSTIVFQPLQAHPTTIFSHACLNKGDHVNVLYNPTNTQDAETSDDASNFLTGQIILTIIWPIIALVAIFYVVYKMSD